MTVTITRVLSVHVSLIPPSVRVTSIRHSKSQGLVLQFQALTIQFHSPKEVYGVGDTLRVLEPDKGEVFVLGYPDRLQGPGIDEELIEELLVHPRPVKTAHPKGALFVVLAIIQVGSTSFYHNLTIIIENRVP